MRTELEIPIENADYFIHYMALPPKIYALVTPNSDGTYTMILDPRRDFMSRLDDWEHEIWHLIRGDLHKDRPVSEIENEV